MAVPYNPKHQMIRQWINEKFTGNFITRFNENDEIIITGNLHLVDPGLQELLYPFAEVHGDFDLSGDLFPGEGMFSYRNLITLKNCPRIVDGVFSCSRNINLTSLEHGPEIVKGDYRCSQCNLYNLNGIAKEIGGYISAFDNPELTDITALDNIIINEKCDLSNTNSVLMETATYKRLSDELKIQNQQF